MTKKKSSANKKIVTQIEHTKSVRLVLAAYFLIMLLLQLFSFENFPALISFLDFNTGLQKLAAILLVTAELMALPFLLGVNTKRALRNISLVSVFVSLLLLSVFEVAAFTYDNTLLFGATADLPGGSWSLFFLGAVWILAVWSMWDLLAAKFKSNS